MEATKQRETFETVYALFTQGGGVTHHDVVMGEHKEADHGEFVVHKDERGVFVLLFEDISSAELIKTDYIAATGNTDVEVKLTLIKSLSDGADAYNMRLYRHNYIDNGEWEDIMFDNYVERLCK